MPFLIKVFLWLKQTNLGLAFLLATASWFLLVATDMHPRQGGPVDTAIWTVLSPVYRVGCDIGTIMFPRYASGVNGLVPLFGAAAQILLLMALWFVGIRIVRKRSERQNDNFQ
jgi:hypothetical protein